MSIEMSTRNTTLYTVSLRDGRTYETFDYDKAERALTLDQAGLFLAECVDCKAVIPVALVDGRSLGVREIEIVNQCPATTSRHMTGHRVAREDYDAYLASKGQQR